MVSDVNYMSLGSPFEFYCKTCFEVLSIASSGTNIKMFRENNAYFVSMLWRWDRIFDFIIKFPYNARSDWLKQRALSEIRERVDGIKLASKYSESRQIWPKL